MMTSFATRPKMAKVRFPGRGSQQRPLVSDSEIIDSLLGPQPYYIAQNGNGQIYFYKAHSKNKVDMVSTNIWIAK